MHGKRVPVLNVSIWYIDLGRGDITHPKVTFLPLAFSRLKLFFIESTNRMTEEKKQESGKV